MVAVLVGALVVAAVATLGTILGPLVPAVHRGWYQLAFYSAWFLTIGGVIGAASGRARRGLAAGLAAGLSAGLVLTATVYIVQHFTGAPAAPNVRRLLGVTVVVGVWIVLWCVLAVFDARVLRRHKRSWREAVVRGVIAAVLSGAAVTVITMQRPADLGTNFGRRYIWTFVGWTLASAPGLAAIIGQGNKEPEEGQQPQPT